MFFIFYHTIREPHLINTWETATNNTIKESIKFNIDATFKLRIKIEKAFKPVYIWFIEDVLKKNFLIFRAREIIAKNVF